MDGVPGLSFHGIRPGESYLYRFKRPASGHVLVSQPFGFPGTARAVRAARDRAARAGAVSRTTATTWSCFQTGPTKTRHRLFAKLKKHSDYYNFNKRTVGDFMRDVEHKGWRATIEDRQMWGEMRMSPTDLADVSGYTYTYLLNGKAPRGTGLVCSEPASASGCVSLTARR